MMSFCDDDRLFDGHLNKQLDNISEKLIYLSINRDLSNLYRPTSTLFPPDDEEEKKNNIIDHSNVPPNSNVYNKHSSLLFSPNENFHLDDNGNNYFEQFNDDVYCEKDRNWSPKNDETNYENLQNKYYNNQITINDDTFIDSSKYSNSIKSESVKRNKGDRTSSTLSPSRYAKIDLFPATIALHPPQSPIDLKKKHPKFSVDHVTHVIDVEPSIHHDRRQRLQQTRIYYANLERNRINHKNKMSKRRPLLKFSQPISPSNFHRHNSFVHFDGTPQIGSVCSVHGEKDVLPKPSLKLPRRTQSFFGQINSCPSFNERRVSSSKDLVCGATSTQPATIKRKIFDEFLREQQEIRRKAKEEKRQMKLEEWNRSSIEQEIRIAKKNLISRIRRRMNRMKNEENFNEKKLNFPIPCRCNNQLSFWSYDPFLCCDKMCTYSRNPKKFIKLLENYQLVID
ncbi:hypothetical protein SNEBB_000696 [Seison nebaliae]|nr:hypothetical protein SNEBB_000696 [Seison nebaliae]